jgi:transposase-like protein
MTRQNDGSQAAIRYSEAFKMAVVRELEQSQCSFEEVRRKYGIGGCATVQEWVRRYGNGTRGKVIRVETPEAINEQARLKQRVRLLERSLADANIELALERQFTRLACERAGIKDVAEFKKKAAGTPPMGP